MATLVEKSLFWFQCSVQHQYRTKERIFLNCSNVNSGVCSYRKRRLPFPQCVCSIDNKTIRTRWQEDGDGVDSWVLVCCSTGAWLCVHTEFIDWVSRPCLSCLQWRLCLGILEFFSEPDTNVKGNYEMYYQVNIGFIAVVYTFKSFPNTIVVPELLYLTK